MLIVLILIVIMFCVKSVSLLSFLKPIIHPAHVFCLSRIPEDSKWELIYSALVCGESLPDGEIRKVFTALGVIHLMVISGTHLIFIEKLWSLLPSFRFKYIFLCSFLVVYTLSSGLRPPVLRALFALFLARMIKRYKLFWSPYWKVQISGMLCLICQSVWVNSISLQLSWLASMGMANRSFSRLFSCALTYVLILPVVSGWGGVHPLSILVNWLLVPITGCLLLPLSMLIIPLPFLYPLTDICWTHFINLLSKIRPVMENKGVEVTTLSSFQIWIYIGVLFIVFQMFFVLHRKWSIL